MDMLVRTVVEMGILDKTARKTRKVVIMTVAQSQFGMVTETSICHAKALG